MSPSSFHYCLILVLLQVVSGDEYVVEPTWADCDDHTTTSIDNNGGQSTFISNITSNSVFKLKTGYHYIGSFVPIRDKTNVTIEGIGGSPSDVVIYCSCNTVGLVFLGMNGLTLQRLSISNCSLTSNHLNQTIAMIEDDYMPEFQSVFHYDSNGLNIAVLMVRSSDVTMKYVNVQNNTGYGLIAVNVQKSFVIDSCEFNHNYNELFGACFSSAKYGLGGGALILYQDTTNGTDVSTNLIVSNTSFMNNSNCQLDNENFIFSSVVQVSGHKLEPFSVSGGGGLTVFLANLFYHVKVNVDNCHFQNNTALVGGGILVAVFVGASNNTVTVMDSMFYRNGLILTLEIQRRTTGEGLSIYKDIPFPYSGTAIPPSSSLTFTIKNCCFKENTATSIAGVAILSMYLVSGLYFEPDTVHFINCSFIGNKAYAISSMFLQESKRDGFQPGMLFYLTDMTFIDNEVLTTHFMLSTKTLNALNTLAGAGVTIVMNGTNNFMSNVLGTPIALTNSLLYISGDLHIVGNSGNAGGGLALIMSYIIVNRNTFILFQNNTAYLQAGAIFSFTSNPSFDFNCYLFFETIVVSCQNDELGSESCPDPKQMNISIIFSNNTAPISNVAFGSTLSDCPWRQPLNDSQDLSNITDTYRLLEAVGVFTFHPPLDKDSLSTPPVRITTDVTNPDPVMLGQQVIVKVVSYDGFDQETPDPISSVVYDDAVNGPQDSKLGNGSYWFVSRNKFNDVPVSIRSKEELLQNTTNTTDFDIGIYSIVSTAGNRFNISIRNCYNGFKFGGQSTSSGDNSSTASTPQQYKTCECLDIFKGLNGVRCFEDNATIIVPNEYWLGNTSDGRWLYQRCLFDYCRQGDKVIVNGQFDDQCNVGYHRRGVLCGECEGNYTQQLGTNRCGRCTTLLTVLFVLYYAFAGFILISAIGRLGVTVTYGYINSLIFFGNIAFQFLSAILPTSSSNAVLSQFLFYPIDALNGGIGFQTCIYNGMTAIQKNLIQFLFPIYLYILLGLHVIAIRYFTNNIQVWIANPAQVFATVILMTYISLLQSSIYGLSFTIVSFEGEDHKSTGAELRWSADPNVRYLSNEHAPLFVISLVTLLFYLIPSMVMLLFPSLAFRTPTGKKFIPIYHAFWAPFKDKFKFWIGLRLFLRIIPLVLSGYVPHPYNLFGLQLFLLCYTLAHIIVRPFTRELQNILDIFMNFVLILLISGSSHNSGAATGDGESFLVFYYVLMICLIYLAIYFVIGHHFYMKYEWLQEAFACLKYFGNRMRNKVRSSMSTTEHKLTGRSVADDSYEEMADTGIFDRTIEESGEKSDKGSLRELHKNRTSSSDLLREPLLDDEFVKR